MYRRERRLPNIFLLDTVPLADLRGWSADESADARHHIPGRSDHDCVRSYLDKKLPYQGESIALVDVVEDQKVDGVSDEREHLWRTACFEQGGECWPAIKMFQKLF